VPVLLQVPGDGTNELRVGLDWERRGLELGLGNVLRRKLDEVVEVSADFVELSRHREQTVPGARCREPLLATRSGLYRTWYRTPPPTLQPQPQPALAVRQGLK